MEDQFSVEDLFGLIAVLSIFVMLPWMFLHYAAKKREYTAKSAGDPAMNADLQHLAEKLEKLVQSLETILDAEVPGWRKHMDRREL